MRRGRRQTPEEFRAACAAGRARADTQEDAPIDDDFGGDDIDGAEIREELRRNHGRLEL